MDICFWKATSKEGETGKLNACCEYVWGIFLGLSFLYLQDLTYS